MEQGDGQKKFLRIFVRCSLYKVMSKIILFKQFAMDLIP